MIDLTTIPNVSGSFPDIVPVDSSAPGLKDGTPGNADCFADIWLAMQAILDHAGLTPNGDRENVGGNSQVLDAILRAAGGPGEIVFIANRGASTVGRLLPLAGQVILAADYPLLVTTTYCGDSVNATAKSFYKTSDSLGATRSTSGTYFVLPNMAGQFIRGIGDSTGTNDRGRDVSGDDDEPGSIQDDQPGRHDHAVGRSYSSAVADLYGMFEGEEIHAFTSAKLVSISPAGTAYTSLFRSTRSNATDITSTATRGHMITDSGLYGKIPAFASAADTEARPTNVGFYAMIRY